MSGLTGWHALVLLVVVVLIFGAAKLPGLAKSVGQSMKIFKNEIKPVDEKPVGEKPVDEKPVEPATPAAPATPSEPKS